MKLFWIVLWVFSSTVVAAQAQEGEAKQVGSIEFEELPSVPTDFRFSANPNANESRDFQAIRSQQPNQLVDSSLVAEYQPGSARPTQQVQGLGEQPLPREPKVGSEVGPEAVSMPAPKSFVFKSGHFYHPSLHFEQPMLERHGATRSEFFQPLVSAGHFLRSSLLYPLSAVRSTKKAETSTGWGVPGSRVAPPRAN